jgi:hypothetical protein
MAFLFMEAGIVTRFLLHHVRGHYPRRDARSPSTLSTEYH